MALIPSCGVDCDAALPLPVFNNCNPVLNVGQITRLYIGKSASADFTDVSLLAEWTVRLLQTGETTPAGDELREFVVIGDKPEPETVERTISDDRIQIVTKNHTINFRVDETGTDNHEAFRLLECGGEFSLWYQTSGGLLYGGIEGLVVKIKANMVIPESSDDLIVWKGTIKWKSKYTEEYVVSPLV